ncbi:uncharacterized protein LOC141664247 isoform X2 [Apium graveolens]|uniref:uncharacterized protein LOC141664247 isoform X2 n=1 Tax=Apium graveolens TaxID=4045 RepID=UPI003D790C5D
MYKTQMEEEKLKLQVTSQENRIAGGWLTYTTAVILIILIYRFIIAIQKLYFSNSRIAPAQPPLRSNDSVKSSSQSQLGSSCIISDSDLKNLIDNLDGRLNDGTEKWENVIEKSSSLLSYSAKCCKSKVGEGNGVEIGRLIKKFPLLTAREYVLAWRLWEKGEDTYYCISKECEHPLAPRQKKYVRVRFLRSGWMIRKVPGRNACEIRMMHQEDAGLNPDMAKLAFAKGIWRYICKMNDALRRYSAINNLQMSSAVNANVRKVPSAVGTVDSPNALPHRELSASDSPQVHKLNRKCSGPSGRPSNKLITNSLILLGGVICLSRGRPNLGAKVAMSYILTKLAKRGPLSQKACFSTTVS